MSLASSRPPLSRALLAGLLAGGAAAIATALVSLVLQSPDRVFINSATVAVLAVVGGLLAGAIYHLAFGRSNPLLYFELAMAAIFVLILVIALLVEALPGHPLLHMATFCIPLAALALILIGILTPAVSHIRQPFLWAGPVAALAALAVGFALAGHSAGPSGRLALPETASGGASVAKRAGGSNVVRLSDVQGLTFTIDPTQSKASYTVREQLSRFQTPDDAVGTTQNVNGTIFLDGRPSTVTVDVKTFKSDQPARDRHLLTDPGLANYAPAQFTVNKLDLPDSYTPGDTITRNVQGTMTINNVSKPMTFAVEARYQDNTLFLHGQTDFTWADFNIRPPSFAELLQVADTIHIEVLAVAQAQS